MPKEPTRVAHETVALIDRHLRSIGFDIAPNFLPRLESFIAALALWGASTNLTAAPDDPAELAFHIIDSLAPLILAQQVPQPALKAFFTRGQRVLDLGSGAGFPALVLAAATEARFTLLEARRKRASFLTVAAAEMGLANVEVDAHHRNPEGLPGSFDVVTARAFAQPAIFYRSAESALRPDGIAILYANPDQELALPAATKGGFGELQLLRYAVPRGRQRVERLLVVIRKL